MLERGVVANSLRDPVPSGPPLIHVEQSETPPQDSRVIVLSLPRGGWQQNDRRYPIAVIGPGYRGLLTSESTRIAGLVSIADIAPTALGRDDALGSEASVDPLRELRTLDRRIDDHNEWRSRTASWLELATFALALAAPAAAVLGVGGFLATNLVLGAVDVAPGIAFALLLASVLAGLALMRRLRSSGAIAAAFALVIGAYLVSFLVDERWVALSPLGPTQNARFYGISNLLETFLLVPALAGAALLARRPLAAAGIAALAFLAVAGSRFGADGGGAIVLAVGFAVLGTLLAGASRRVVVGAVALAVALVLGLVAIDAFTGASSHVRRALEDGPGGLASELSDRVTLSWERATASWSTGLTIALGIAVLALLAGRLARLRLPLSERALPFAFAAAIATSLIVNDSPKDVILAGLAGYVAVEALALGRNSAAGALAARLPLRARAGPRTAAQP